MKSNSWRLGRSVLLCLSMCALAACNGERSGGQNPLGTGGNDGPGGGDQRDRSIGGIWFGIDPISGQDVLGIASEDGDFHFVREDLVQYAGEADTEGSTVTGDFVGFTPPGFEFEDGSTRGTGTISGLVEERERLQLDVVFTTSEGTQDSGTITLAYDEIYERDSSLSTIAGNYATRGTNGVINVNSNGEVFAQNSTTGCTANGEVSIIDERYNAYRVEWTYSNCAGELSDLNGLTFSGLATLDDTTENDLGVVLATASSGSDRVAEIWVFDRV